MKFTPGLTYSITFPNNQTITAKFIETLGYPSSGMPNDYLFEGISGDFPKHETMYPQFPLPEFLIAQTKFNVVNDGQSPQSKVDLEQLLEDYNNCAATVTDSIRAEEIMKEIWENKSVEYREQIQKALTDRLVKLEAVGLA